MLGFPRRVLILGMSIAMLDGPSALSHPSGSSGSEELLIGANQVGRLGGRLVVGLRAEPKTLNPLLALDAPSREVISRMHADLISINPKSQVAEPALARSWTVSKDGRLYTIHLRHGLRFSDGAPFTADDVVFTFAAWLDEKVHSPQRDLLIVGGSPVEVSRLDGYTVTVRLAAPYAAAERLFDSLPMLPRHLLEKRLRDGTLGEAWRLTSAPGEIAGMGPFRLKHYRPGERLVLERNPYFWQADSAGQRLPYLDEIEYLAVGSEDAQIMRFVAGQTDILNRVSPRAFSLIAAEGSSRGDVVDDAGPSLESNFLLFNLTPSTPNTPTDLAFRQSWFRRTAFRRAISMAVDREAIIRLVYNGRGAPLWGPVTPGNKLWINSAIPHPARSVALARKLLASSGFSWNQDGLLLDPAGRTVEFSTIVSASNTERVQMATILESDLRELGMKAHIASLEFRSFTDRVLNSRQFDTAIMALGGGDADPNASLNVWLSSGAMHLWNPNQHEPGTPWEAEIDALMRTQLSAIQFQRRKQLYDRVQQLLAENVPMVFLASPDVVVAARKWVGNFSPAVLADNPLWNAPQLFRLDLH